MRATRVWPSARNSRAAPRDGTWPCARASVEPPFCVVKQQFGYAKVLYRGLAKNTARLTMLFALGNVWMARRQLIGAQE